jgi:hypothetical protein
MRIFMLFLLLLLGQGSFAAQDQAFMLRDYKHRAYYPAYQANNMTRHALGGMAYAMRHCKMVDRLSFIKNEKLAYDSNIAGAFYCVQPRGLRTYAVVKRFKRPHRKTR